MCWLQFVTMYAEDMHSNSWTYNIHLFHNFLENYDHGGLVRHLAKRRIRGLLTSPFVLLVPPHSFHS